MAAIRADFDVGISQRSKTKVQAELNNMFKRMSGRKTGFSINDKSFTQPLGRITASANEFTKSLEASNARVIAFGASVGVINAVSDAFKGLVMETLQFEKTLADINVVMNASTSALRGFGDELFNVARNTAQGFNVVAEAALEFSRQGLTMEETLRRTNDALILTRLTGLKATEAVSGLTAAVNAFGSAGLTTTEIIDKLAAVDVNFAVSSEDLIHALERTGAVAISAGVELNNLIGLVTALQQNTARGGSVIGNGLKTIFTRIQRPASLRQLEDMSIAVRDLTGAVLPADKILQNIAKTFDSLSQAQQSNLVQFSAGIFQANIFRATLADLSKQQNIFSKASEIAADAAGNAAVKNAALNQTLSAMVSQTKSSIQELAGALGEIMLEDSLKGWTKGFQFLVDGLTNALDGSEGKGSDFAKGFFKGLGNVLTGPIAIAIGVVFVKLLANVAKFAGQSLKDVLGVTSEKEKMLKMENGIIEALGRNKHIQQALNNLEGDRLAQEEFMLKVIEAQTNAMQEQKRLAQGLARPLMDRGVNPDLTASNVPGGGRPLDLDGDGQYDSFTAGGLIPQAVKRERMGAIKGGYTPGAVSTMSIDGLGSVIYNKAEKVKRFPGMRQPAIMPPEKSNAGQEYKQKFSSKHGFNPYASHGLVPNFAGMQNNAENMKLMGTGQMNAPMYIEKQIASTPPGEQIYLNIKSKASALNNKNWKISPDSLSLGELLSSLGINDINTTLPFDFIPGTTGKLKSLPKEVRSVLTDPNNETKGDGAESIFLGSDQGAGYTSTGGVQPGAAPGEYSVDRTTRAPNANLDAYKSGSPAIEVKAGDLDLLGVVKKSIRRYSNESFRNSIRNTAGGHLYDDRSNALHPDMTNHQVAEELINTVNHLEKEFITERLSELAKNGNWSPVGMSEEELEYLIANNKLRENLRNSGFTASDADKELLNNIGFSAGFIPNFRKEGSSTTNYKALTDGILSYPGKLPTFEDLAVELGYGENLLGSLSSKLPNSTRRAFVNYYTGIKDHMGSGASVYTKEQARSILSDVSDKLSSTRKMGYAQNLGLTFEDNLRNHIGVPRPAGQPHMDFPDKTLSGVDKDKADAIFLSTKTAGDAYKGQKGHPVPHFISKYLREKLGPGGSKTYDFTQGQGEKLKDFALDPNAKEISFKNMGQFSDIVGIKNGSRRDEIISGDETLDAIFQKGVGLQSGIENFGEITNPSEKRVKFHYMKDYVTAMSGGFIPNYKKLYQAYVGSDGSGGQTVRRNRNGDQWYYDSQKGTDGILEDWTKVKAKLPMGENVQDMYSREYSITDKNLKQMTSGVYDAENLRKLRVMSKAFEANNELPDQNDEEWEEDYLNTGGDEWEEANDEMEGRLGAYSRLRRTGKQDFLWRDSMAGTITNPQPLASYEKNMFGPGYVIPQLGNEAMFRDGFTNEDGDKIRSIFSQNLNRDNHLVERKLTNEYLDNQGFAKDLSQAAKSPDKAMNAARQRGIKSIGDHMSSKGLIPNFAGLSKSKRLKSFHGEYEDLAKMGSPLASWALKVIKDKEFQMIGNGVESWAIGNEDVVYKLPRPMIDSFSKTGDLELKRWRKQMKVMAQPSLEYEVGPENKAWNLVPDSNIAKRAERIKSQLDSSGIDSLFLPNTEVLKVAGQDEFITSQERVKGSTFLNLQNEILKKPENKTDFNIDGYKIVEHLMEEIGESTMIRDVHSGNFIAEAGKKKQLLSAVNKFAPVGSKESKHLSGLGLRGLPGDSIAAIDFSSGLIPNFAKTFYDFDETLATYPSSVTSSDLFNAESASLAEPTDLAKSLKGRTLDILTARAGESKPFISNKLKSWGINSGRIITTGSIQNGQTSAQKKATILQNMQKKNGGQYNLIDDAPENIAAIKALGNKNLMGELYKFSGQSAGRGSGNSKGLVPNFLSWRDRPGGGSKIPSPDSPGLYSKEEVEELKGMGYKRTDSHGWHFAEPVGLKHTPPTTSSPFGQAGPVSFDFLSRMIQHDREMYSIPNRGGDNANLDELGQSLIKGQKDSAIIGYDSSVNRMQLIEGNHRVAALGRLNKDRDKTQKFYTGMHAYVSGIKLKDQSQMDHAAGFVNQQIYPPKIPDDIIEAKKDPYRAPGQHVQGSWPPSDFGIPNFFKLDRRNLSDGDKMSDRQRLLRMWQEKMGELKIGKEMREKGVPPIDIHPVTSRINVEANTIWDELQKLRKGEDYETEFPFEIPNFAVDLSNGYHDRKSIGSAISKVYKSKTGKKMGRQDVDFSIERYISAMKDKQIDDGDNFTSNYPGGHFSIGGEKFNFNEISMALLKHGQFVKEKSKGLVPNFENVHLKRGQTDPDAPLMEPSINPVLYEPILGAETPEDVYNKLSSFMQAHATGRLSGRSSMGTSGDIGKKIEDYITKSFIRSDGTYKTWAESSDPYSETWINEDLGTTVDPSGFLDIASGAVSYTTRDAIAEQFHKSKKDGGKAKGKIHEATVPRKNIFGKKKVMKMLNAGANPPSYPMVDKLKNSIRDGSFFDYWKDKGGLFINIDGERNDRSLIGLDQELNELRPKLGKGEARTSMFTGRMPTIAPHVDRESGQFYNEQEVTRIANHGLVPNFVPIQEVRKAQKDRIAGDGAYVGASITDSEKQVSREIYDYFVSRMSFSDKFGYDDATMSFRGDSLDFTKIFRHADISTNRKNLIKIAGSENKLDKLLKSYMMAHTSAILEARGRFEIEPDPLMMGAMSRGLVPNFSRPLADAINREKAAGIPESMIRIDRSSQLMGPQNPMGLAVINTRDEPQGVQQGINRARSMGIDPKKHGMQFPNFASGDLNPEVQEMLKDFVAQKISDGIQKALDGATNVRSAGGGISNDDFEKAGFDKADNNFKYSGGHIKRELEKGDTKESLRVNQVTKNKASSFKLQAEQKLKSLEKNPTGTKDEADQIAALNRVIEGLGSLGSALDEHANSISDDTGDYIKELAKTQNGIKDASKEQIKSAAESGMSPKIKDTIKEGSEDTNQLRAAADQARAQLTKDEQTWKNSKGPDKGKALDDMQKSRENVLKLKASEDMINKETEARKNGLQQLFYFQSMISMANGFLQQMSETGAGATKVIADLGIAASDTFAAMLQARELGREASEAMGVGEGEGFSLNPFSAANKKGNQARLKADEESRNRVALGQGGTLENLRFSEGDGLLGKLSQGAGEAGTAFGRLIPALGQAYAAFTFLDSSMKFVTKSSGEAVDFINSFGFEIEKGEGIMALFKNGVERAQSRIDKLGKSAEVTAKALEAVKSSQETSIKIAELEQLGVRRTLKQDRELHQLQVKEITGKTALTQARTQLTDADLMGRETATLMAHQLSEVSMSGKDTEKLLRSLNVVIQRNILLQQSRKNFEERQQDEANFMDYHSIGATIGGGILAAAGTVLTGGGLLVAGAVGLTAGAASGAAGGATKDKMYSEYDISGVNPEQMETMTRLMEGRAHEILQEYSQALYGGDKDSKNRSRTLKEKVNSYEKNMDVINRAIASHADHGPSAMISILDQLHGSEGFGEQSREELINALKDYIDTGADMQDNPTHAMLGGEKLATDRGLSIITRGMAQGKGALEKEDENKIQAEINMKTVKIQERLFRNFEMELKNQSHRLDMEKKSLELDNEINTIKESLLSEHGFILNSVQIENQNARKRKSIDAKFESTKQNINAKISEQFIELLKDRADFQNISPSIVGATESGENKKEIEQGGMSLMAEAISRGGVAGPSLLRGTTLEGSLDETDIEGEISKRFDDIGIKAERYGVAIENARKFFEVYSKSIAGEKDGGMALTSFAESVNNVSSPLERYAVLMMGELSGLASASDSGKGLNKMMETLRKSQTDLESANVDYAAEIRKNEEQLRNKRISEKTLLGAGLLERQIVDDKIVEKQPEVMEKTFEGQAAYYNALNKVSKERIDILTRSKNFELSILANLQNEVTKSSESDLKSLKQAEFKNKIFATNKDLLTSAVSRVLTEAEEVKLSNKNKEVKLQMISDQEYIASLTKSQIESEILDSQISQKQAEEKRKLLESTQYARILAESQAKNELESVRISRINNEQKLIAQVANGDISSLVSEEFKSKLASTRTEALKAAESAIQLQLNKEQTKKIQKANELLDLSNKFTAMQNAEMLANSSSENIRLGNQIQRSTDQFNMIAGAKSAVDMAAMTGNPDDKAEAANQISDLERSITGKSGALTALAQKMAEVEVAASSLSADLASTMFDSVRSGFGNLLKDISTGAESAGDAWKKFGLGVAQQLLDRVMQNNIDKMMSNLTYAFTGVKNDPESQQKMLASITSKSTSATKKLTEKIEALKKSLESGIGSNDKGSGELDSSLKPGSVTEISNRLSKGFSSVTINAEDASVALSEVSTKATNLANFFEEIYKPEMKKLGEKEGSSKEVQSRYEMMQQRAARNNSNLESAQRVASITEKNKTKNRIDIESIEKRIKDLSGGADMNDIFESTLGEYADSSKKYSYGEHTSEMKEQYAKFNYGKDFGHLKPEKRNEISDKVERFYPKFADDNIGNEASAEHAKRRKDDSGVWRRDDSGMEGTVDFARGPDKAKHIFVEGDTAPIEFEPDTGFQFIKDLFTEGRELTKDDYRNFEAQQEGLNNKKAEQEAEFAKLNDRQTDSEVLDGHEKIDTTRIASLKAEKEKLKKELEKTVAELSAITNVLKQSNIKQSALRTKLESLGGTAPSLPAPKVGKIGKEFFGGKIQHFHDGGFVQGEPGRDKVPAMLTAGEYVVPKGMMQAFEEGGRVMSGLKGSAQMVTMALVTEEIADAVNGDPEDKAPTFDMKKLNTVDIGSDVSIGRGDPRMSARAMTKDPVMKEYKDYLLKKASFDVQKKNEKFQERMGMLGTVVGAINSFAISQVTELLKEPINNLVKKGDNFISQKLDGGKFSEEFDSKGFPKNLKYRDIAESKIGGKTRLVAGTGGSRVEFDGGKWKPFPELASGGQIPAMLTAGEAYVPADMAKKIGYDSLNRINKEGIIQGPGGIDNVGPVGLNPGDFIIRKSSTDKLLNANPNGLRDSLMGGGFTRRATQGYYNGGMAGDSLTVPSQSLSPRRSNFDTSVSNMADQEISATQEKTTNQSGSSATTNNINVSVKIDSSGKETVESSTDGEGSYEREKDLSIKIKSAVLDVIRQEKRVGGELS